MNSLKPVQPAESNMSLEDFQSEDDSSTTYNKGFIVNHDRDDEEIKISRGRIQLRKGFIYLNKLTNEHCELIEYLNENLEVVVRACDTKKTSIVSIHNLSNITDSNNQHINVDISKIGDTYWEKAQQKFEVIKPILDAEYQAQQNRLVASRSQETNIPVPTLYRWLSQYRAVGSIAGLVDKKRGWSEGQTRLEPKQEEVIERVINAFYLNKQRASLEQTYREVHRICSLEKIKKPSKKAIKYRINKISEKEQLAKRGQVKLARKKFSATPYEFPNADTPLAVVQIDHTPVDLMLVDSEHRKPIGRPYLTLAIDVYSRMVTGYYLSLDPPSVISTSMCLSRSILPKNKLLLEHGLTDVTWQVFGYPRKVHTDNGADFRASTFAKSCEIHGIDIEYRPVGKPHYGAHIERLMGTFMKEIHGLRGTTFSNIKQKDTYDSEKEAVMTFDEFELWLLTYITRVYHQREHSTLGRSPIEQWNIGIYGDEETMGIGVPAMPVDEKTLLLDFMPSIGRTIQHFGVTIDGLKYYDTCLNPFINATTPDGNKREFLFRRDPRDISKLWFYDETLHRYFVVPFANQKLPSMSIWEYRQIRNRIKEKGDAYMNENQIFEALTEMREMVEQSAKSTKTARRQAERQKTTKKNQTIIAKTLSASKKIANTDKYDFPESDVLINTDSMVSALDTPMAKVTKPNPIGSTTQATIANNGLNNGLLSDDDTDDFDFGDIE